MLRLISINLGVRKTGPWFNKIRKKYVCQNKSLKSGGPKFGPLLQLNPQKRCFSKQIT